MLPTYYVDEDGVHDVEKHAEQLRVRDAMIADGNSWLADEQRAVVALAEGMTTAEGARAELSGFISRYPYRAVRGSLPAGCRLGATFWMWGATSLKRSGELEHRAAGIGEIDLALTVRDQHAMRMKKVGAEQHRRG